MTACLRYAPLIGAREGELSPEEARDLATHLAGCARCQALAADLAATDGLLSEALLARANARDFAPFVDQVMERVYPGSAPAAAVRRGLPGWLGLRWKALLATGVPALAALALFLYVQYEAQRPEELALVELSSEGQIATVLQTVDGPIVLIDDDDTSGS
ncbi:MAG: zf-HC2 domain-containing protein [Anaeromyxobacter sp.]